MPKRKMSTYQLFAASFLRARSKPGMTKQQLQELMKEAGRAWQRARRGQNPFPELNLHIDMVEESLQHKNEWMTCPVCGDLLEVPPEAAGEIVECGACGAELMVMERNPNKQRQMARHETRLAWSRGMGEVNRELKQLGDPAYYIARHAYRRLMKGKPYAEYSR